MINEAELKLRFRNFALAIVKLCTQFPKEPVYLTVQTQIIKSASSSAANYNAVCRAKSLLDFINKLKIVEEELDETIFWLDFLNGVSDKWHEQVYPLSKEGNELLSTLLHQ